MSTPQHRITVGPVSPEDLNWVQETNEAAVPHVNSLPLAALARLVEEADHFRVARVAGEPAGFLLAFGPRAGYESPNYRWFRARYPDFLYIDRVAVGTRFRRRGVGWRLYRDAEAFARGRAARLACEVNLRPANEGSLAFHRRFGFRPVGTQETEGGGKTVSLLVKELAHRPRPAVATAPARPGGGAGDPAEDPADRPPGENASAEP